MSGYTNNLLDDLEVVTKYMAPSDDYFLEVDEGSPAIDQKELTSIVMAIRHLAMRTRPDVLFHVTFLATRIYNARQQDLQKAIRVLGYILATKERGIVLRVRGTLLVFEVDASYAIHPGARSHAGFHVTLGDPLRLPYEAGPIVIRSYVINEVMRSSIKLERFARQKCSDFVYITRSLMRDFGFDQTIPSMMMIGCQAVCLDHADDEEYIAIYSARDDMIVEATCRPLHAKADMRVLVRLCNDR